MKTLGTVPAITSINGFSFFMSVCLSCEWNSWNSVSTELNASTCRCSSFSPQRVVPPFRFYQGVLGWLLFEERISLQWWIVRHQ